MSKCPFHNSNPGNTFDISNYDPDIFDENRKVLIAQQLYSPSEEIVPASSKRDWMDNTNVKFAYRCLPLKIANELGWCITTPYNIRARWNGGPWGEDTEVEVEGDTNHFCSSHFGYGVLTFGFRTLFRTSVGHCLYVKGPTNYVKHGIQALEGLVETDWLTFTFTMNWKITKPNEWVEFKRGEPVCQVFPYPKHYIQEFEPIRKDISAENLRMYESYRDDRNLHNSTQNTPGTKANKEGWQKHYFRGEYPDEQRTKCQEFGFDHKIKIACVEFDDQRERKKTYPTPSPTPVKKKSIIYTQ